MYALVLMTFLQVGGRQRLMPKSTDVMNFKWDQAGYHFCTTGGVCDTVTKHAPKFVSDLTKSLFGKSPKALSLAVVHTGGAKIIRSLMSALQLNCSESEALSWESMSGVKDPLGKLLRRSIIYIIVLQVETYHLSLSLICC